MRRHKLGFRIDRTTNFEQWYVVRYRDEELVEDLHEDDLEVLGTIMILYTATVKVKFFSYRMEGDLEDLELIIRDICKDLGVKETEVDVVKCDPVGFTFDLSEPMGIGIETEFNDFRWSSV